MANLDSLEDRTVGTAPPWSLTTGVSGPYLKYML